MDVSLDLWTDSALLAIFDPAVFEAFDPIPYTFQENKEVQEGRYALIGLQGDGAFRVRITDDHLTVRERELLNETLGPLGLVIHSGQTYVSGMDLPGGPTQVYAEHGAGSFIALEPGEYNLYIHEVNLLSLSEEV